MPVPLRAMNHGNARQSRVLENKSLYAKRKFVPTGDKNSRDETKFAMTNSQGLIRNSEFRIANCELRISTTLSHYLIILLPYYLTITLSLLTASLVRKVK
jgi:hypothetical protein